MLLERFWEAWSSINGLCMWVGQQQPGKGEEFVQQSVSVGKISLVAFYNFAWHLSLVCLQILIGSSVIEN